MSGTKMQYISPSCDSRNNVYFEGQNFAIRPELIKILTHPRGNAKFKQKTQKTSAKNLVKDRICLESITNAQLSSSCGVWANSISSSDD